MDDCEPLVVSPKHACIMLDVSLPTLYGLIDAGALDSYKDGASRKVTVASIKRHIAARLRAKAPKQKMPRSPGRPPAICDSARLK